MRSKFFGLALLAAIVCQLPLRAGAAEIQLGTSGGIFTVPVQINGSVTMQFLVDPGAGVVVIPVSVLRQLVANGTVTDSDVIGVGTAELADSSLYLTARVRLHELRIGDIAVRDVTAAVAPGLSQPLLGQSFFRRFAAVTFDNRRHVLILSDEGVAVAAQPPAAAWVAPYYPSYPTTRPLSGGGYPPPAYSPGYGR
ncbi:MAG: TIGR02281 family clan AA aspartic protease [Thiohalocapsa sp.]